MKGGSALHIGPGKLGLGLIVDLAIRASLATHLVGRPSSPAKVRNYRLELTGEQPKSLDVDSYSPATSLADLCNEATTELSNAPSILLTTAVGMGLAECADLICEIASQRQVGERLSTVFIACENDLGPEYGELERRLHALGVDCRRTMVNRLCTHCDLDDEETTLVVRADPHAEWLIEGDPDHDVLTSLETLAEVRFVTDVEPFAVRKRWLVNGGHLALGLFGLRDKVTNVAVVAREKGRQQELREIHASMVQALPPEWEETLGDSIDYAEREIVPICRTADDVPRILSRLQRGDMLPFFASVERRLAEPARQFVRRHDYLAHPLESVFELLHDALLDLESYGDAVKVKNGEVALSFDADDRAIRAYRTLLQGVLSAQAALTKVGRLERQLARHRAAYG